MKFKYLEYIRAIAALIVFIGHLACDLPFLVQNKYLYLQMVASWGPQAVVVFFMLSGIVINHTSSFYKNQTRKDFIKKRAIRILPVYYCSLLFMLFVDAITHYTGTGVKNYIGSFLMVATLQGVFTGVPNTISTVWSLSFEVFFYLIFSLTIGKHHKNILIIWVFLSFICVVVSYFYTPQVLLLHYLTLMLTYSSIWLVGYYIYEFRKNLKTNFFTAMFACSIVPLISRLSISNNFHDPIIFLLTSILCAPLFVLTLSSQTINQIEEERNYKIYYFYFIPIYLIGAFILFHFSKSLFISKMLYLIAPIATLLFLSPTIKKMFLNLFVKLENFLLFIASISYAFYLIHLPIICLFGRLMPHQFILSVILIIITTFLLSTFLERYLQKKIKLFFR